MNFADKLAVFVLGSLLSSGLFIFGYSQGWKHGQEGLREQQWDAHHPGKEYLDPAKCELLSTPDGSKYWYECKAPKGGFK